jgi:hypothetical protein
MRGDAYSFTHAGAYVRANTSTDLVAHTTTTANAGAYARTDVRQRWVMEEDISDSGWFRQELVFFPPNYRGVWRHRLCGGIK